MLMALLNCSAQTYPKLSVINKDTVVLITLHQAEVINESFERNRQCDQLDIYYHDVITSMSSVSHQKDTIIINLRNTNRLQDSIIANKVMLLYFGNEKLKDEQNHVEWLKGQRFILFALTLFFAGAAVIK